MKISKIDSSNYLKGLMLLIRKDHRITETENILLMRIGKSLGFDAEFCEKTINDILNNNFIEDTPPLFAEKELAVKFIKDGLAVIFSDNIIHPAEEEWLIATAVKNDIDLARFYEFKKEYAARQEKMARLEVDDLIVSQ
ncbi:MAG: hypothetical protein IAE93_16290 [Ignavibacteria bacterium]|nr:hypothetical protein [Ignavibacteria bacterium]